MIDARVFDELAASLSKILPAGVSDLKTDFEKNAKATLQSTLGKMDLVTREEFEVQALVLQKTREKLEALERQLATLEQQLELLEQQQSNNK
ncbi:MAG: accessory factor UbiK family protein [Granulosicoccus sp.]|nr:accessory factor UbiK family protein [Granulosicoccus sp.]